MTLPLIAAMRDGVDAAGPSHGVLRRTRRGRGRTAEVIALATVPRRDSTLARRQSVHFGEQAAEALDMPDASARSALYPRDLVCLGPPLMSGRP